MKITEIPAKLKEQSKIRVAAYARVSSDKDAAFHSLEAQTEYYENLVAAHTDWKLVGIYSDNGISGTTIDRPEFQHLLLDCRARKIDLVVTKSVTRFARNTVILLQTIREFKRLGVDCYFEKEDMHSISPDGELLLTLLAMYAEEEARSASENQLWRIRKLYEQGKAAGGHIYGYRFHDGTFVIVPEEAEVVRRIFNMFLSGMGLTKIARTLTLEGILPIRSLVWSQTTIKDILQNEKYAGNMILQQSYHDNFRTKRAVRNHGERRKYYVEDSHEPIVSKETFRQVQEELERRKQSAGSPQCKPQGNFLFTGLIRCSDCGKLYQHKRTYAGKYDKDIWVCPNYRFMGKRVCSLGELRENILIEKTKEVLKENDLNHDLLLRKITEIVVKPNHYLTYNLSNNTSITVQWQHHSRKESWTPEMRQMAREKALQQRKEREKNAKSDSD